MKPQTKSENLTKCVEHTDKQTDKQTTGQIDNNRTDRQTDKQTRVKYKSCS